MRGGFPRDCSRERNFLLIDFRYYFRNFNRNIFRDSSKKFELQNTSENYNLFKYIPCIIFEHCIPKFSSQIKISYGGSSKKKSSDSSLSHQRFFKVFIHIILSGVPLRISQKVPRNLLYRICKLSTVPTDQ